MKKQLLAITLCLIGLPLQARLAQTPLQTNQDKATTCAGNLDPQHVNMISNNDINNCISLLANNENLIHSQGTILAQYQALQAQQQALQAQQQALQSVQQLQCDTFGSRPMKQSNVPTMKKCVNLLTQNPNIIKNQNTIVGQLKQMIQSLQADIHLRCH